MVARTSETFVHRGIAREGYQYCTDNDCKCHMMPPEPVVARPSKPSDDQIDTLLDKLDIDWGDMNPSLRKVVRDWVNGLAPETNSLPDPALLNEIIKPVPQHEAEAFAQSGVGYPAEKAFVQLCAPHGKDWLTCPECAKAADKMAVKEREGKL